MLVHVARSRLAAPGLRRQNGRHAADARDLADHFFRGLAQRLELARALGRHRDREIDAIVLDQDLGDEPELDDVGVEIGTLHAPQALENLALRNGHPDAPRVPALARSGSGHDAGGGWATEISGHRADVSADAHPLRIRRILADAALEVTGPPRLYESASG